MPPFDSRENIFSLNSDHHFTWDDNYGVITNKKIDFDK